MTHLTVLLIDDNPDDRALVERELRQHIAGIQVEHAGEASALEAAISAARFDLAITDYRLRWSTGTEVLRELKRRFPHKPVIMFTGSGNEEVAVAAMKEGLDDYITKTVKHYPRIPYAVTACVERARQREELRLALERETLGKLRLEVALQSARMGTWQVDLRSGELLYSPEVGPMYGRASDYTHASIDAWLGDIDAADRPAVLSAWQATLADGRPFSVQFRTHGAAPARWIACSGKRVDGDDSVPRLVIGTARDVSEEVATREALVRQQEDLRSILDVLPVGVAISDDARADSIMFTPYLAEMLGVPAGHDVSASGAGAGGRPFQSYCDGMPIQPHDLPMQRSARTGVDVR
ncbi:MAG: response regulator, partial [Gammaproteobacteria bacterium]